MVTNQELDEEYAKYLAEHGLTFCNTHWREFKDTCEECEADEEWNNMTLKERREAMGGAYGGDRADD